ncbi:MAG: prepilin peptidase, partial [Ktedonobacterales bacterium]
MSIQILYFAGSFVAGLGAGSAVNVLSDRVYDEEAQYQKGQCQSCGATLPAKRLVPLAGFTSVNRRCRACGKAASLRAPICGAVLAITYPL